MIRKYVQLGEQTPAYYRIAWYDWFEYRGVAYPIGIHLMMKLLRRLWEWSHQYRPSKIEYAVRFSRSQGYNEGYEAGYKAGIEKNAVDAFIEAIKERA